MLNLTASTLHRSYEYPIAPDAKLVAAGCVLVNGSVAGTVAPSTGADGEHFVSFSASRQMTLFSVTVTENFEVPATSKVVLTHTPEPGTIFSPAKAGLTATDKTVDVGTDLAGTIIAISYRFVPTTIEARFLQGDGPAGGAASIQIGTVTTVTAGTIFTSEYDTTKNWADVKGKVIGAGADGRVTVGDAADIKCPIPNARVVAVPSSGAAELGLYFSA